MTWTWQPRRIERPELMEQAGQDPRAVAASLTDLRRINRWLGGVDLTVRALDRLTNDLSPGSSLTILDVATGGGDLPRAVYAWGNRRGLTARIIATDLSPPILRLAARASDDPFDYAVADGRRLPLRDASVDVALCSLVVHHLAPDDVVLLLREMRRVSRRGVIVNDLVRSWFGLIGAWLVSRPLSRITRHDAPVSVRRAYTRAELAALATHAGLGAMRFDGWLGYRVAGSVRSHACQ